MAPPVSYFISIGSNVEPEKNIPAALDELRARFRISAVSSVYETPPFGPAGDKNFWNLAVRLESPLPAESVRKELQEIERSLGREPSPGGKDYYPPRTIDLDILPKKGYQKLAFVMVPLAEIASGEKDESTGLSFGEIAGTLRQEAARFRIVRSPEN